MAAGNRRTRDHLLIVLNLYLKLRFGQFDGKQPVIVDLAMRIGRTLRIERVMHGARDLPNRILEDPEG